MIDPEIGFTSDVIRDPKRFVGRGDLIRDCIHAINARLGLIAVYGKRGVGKSSLLRQIQNIALGDYSAAKSAGLYREIPAKPRTYLTVYYTCDAMIDGAKPLVTRLCNDQDVNDGLLRLVPNDGKELVEFTRTEEKQIGSDLKLINWGDKGIESSKYARVVPGDPIQTFRNFVSSVVTHQVHTRMKRDGLLILLDEFDVIRFKDGLGSLIKSMTSADLKFGICGIGHDLGHLISDHRSVERLLEQGAVHVGLMDDMESEEIIARAESLFKGALLFDPEVKTNISRVSQGYPYLTQLVGKACVNKANQRAVDRINLDIYDSVLDDIRRGVAFPMLETAYQKAIGNSEDRKILLHILAEQPEDNTIFNEDVGRVFLNKARKDASSWNIQYVDQLIPRLLEAKYGPILARVTERPGVYEFVNPVFRLYVQLRNI